MKRINYKKGILSGILMFACMFIIPSCEIEEIPNPNGPSLESILSNATLGELQNLASGMESGMRERLNTYLDGVGVIGREFYRFSGSDPRFTSDLLGKGSATLDNNTFYTTRPFEARYRVIKNGNILLTAVSNTTADITAEQKNGFTGYAKTIKAYQLLLALMPQYQNGVRIDVDDPGNLGAFKTYDESLTAIAEMLDAGAVDLDNAGTEWLVPLGSGFSGSQDPPLFNDPVGFRQFNRAIAVRVAVYRSLWSDALTYLGESFYDPMGDLDLGVYHTYSSAGGDLLNEMFFALNSSPGGQARIAQPDFISDAESGDTRLGKAVLRDETAFQDGLSGDYDFFTFTSASDPIGIIRNEELILLHAEASAQLDNTSDAVGSIDIIRSSAGLLPYTGGMTKTDLINEMLHQKRYSLYGEGYRWIDMRRYNKLGELPIDRVDDDVWEQFPRPMTEL